MGSQELPEGAWCWTGGHAIGCQLLSPETADSVNHMTASVTGNDRSLHLWRLQYPVPSTNLGMYPDMKLYIVYTGIAVVPCS